MQSLTLPGIHEGRRDATADGLLVPRGTSVVRRDHLRVVTEIRRLWPTLDVVACRCNHCIERGHYPYLVIERTRSGRTVPVMGATAVDGRLLRRLYDAHAARGRDLVAEAREHNARELARRGRAEREHRRARLEVIRDALASPKFRYRARSMGMETTP